MLELRVKNDDGAVLDIHSDVTFYIGRDEDGYTIRDYIEAFRANSFIFVAALMLEQTIDCGAIKFRNDGFTSKGLEIDELGEPLQDNVLAPFRTWEVVYIE